MRYKVGDIVRIREDIEIHKEYDGLTFWSNMYEDLYGKDLIVDRVEDWCYDICSYYITESMLAPKLKYPIIAVDLDNTIVDSKHCYPYMDSMNLYAINILKKYRKMGGKIIIWTLRTDDHLDIALKALSEVGLEWDAINANLQESIDKWNTKYPNMTFSPKVYCDLFIDDRAYPANIIGIDWKALGEEICKYD